MKKRSVSFAESGLAVLAFVVFMGMGVLTAAGAEELYLRGVGGDWEVASEKYRLEIVSETAEGTVYNWTGDVPTEFIVASAGYEICLGDAALNPGSNSPARIVGLEEIEKPGSEEDAVAMIRVGGTVANRRDQTLVVQHIDGRWDAKLVRAFHFLVFSDDDVFVNKVMAVRVEGLDNIYGVSVPVEGSNISFQSSNGSAYYNKASNLNDPDASTIGPSGEYELSKTGSTVSFFGTYVDLDGAYPETSFLLREYPNPEDLALTGVMKCLLRTSAAGENVFTSVSSIESEEPGEPVWFDLTGRRVSEPDRGIYVRRDSTRAVKVAF